MVAQGAPTCWGTVTGVEEQHSLVYTTRRIRIIAWRGETLVVVKVVGVCQIDVHVSPGPRVRAVVGRCRRAPHVSTEEEFLGRINMPIGIAENEVPTQ